MVKTEAGHGGKEASVKKIEVKAAQPSIPAKG